MPLPPSVPRDELHLRRIELRGYRRHDGLYDIEARMVDTKTHELRPSDGRRVPPGDPIHDMWIRLVVDEDLNVVDLFAATDASPFGICREATRPVADALRWRWMNLWLAGETPWNVEK